MIYVEVPSGHPGVDLFTLEEGTNVPRFLDEVWINKGYAIIGVLKGV